MKHLGIMLFIAFYFQAFGRDLSGNSMFADQKSRKIGDLITVMIMESASASNEAKTATSTSGKLSGAAAGTGSLAFVPQMGLTGSSANSYDGSGKTERKGTLQATITAVIKDILPNGNFIIEGNKIVEVNGEKQITTVSGIIRQQDILDNNSVFSNEIANLQINYTGDGVVQDSEEPGVITKFFNWLF